MTASDGAAHGVRTAILRPFTDNDTRITLSMNLSNVRNYTPTLAGDEKQQAAVLAPVIHCNHDPQLVFTKRAAHLGEHPGQMSFPGGSHEATDGSLEMTAWREATEEIGLQRANATLIGQLDDIVTISNYIVRPFVSVVPDRVYDPDESEVAEVVQLPIAALIQEENYQSVRRRKPGGHAQRLHFFSVDGYTVWGATGAMTVQLLELTTSWRAPSQPEREIGPDQDLPI